MIPISCKCITYGRTHLLEESLNSFINQKYDGERELVIINDYPLQKLEFDHPLVRIINLDFTFKTIGEKENFAVSSCKYDTIAVWDDDDVALSNHLSNINKYFVENSDLLHWSRAVLYNEPNISAITGVGNSGIVFSRKIWNQLGGYPFENAGYDMTFVVNIKNNSKNISYGTPPDNEVSWFYMWGGRGYHMSGQGTDVDGRPNVIFRHSEYVEECRLRGEIPTGIIKLKPRWNHDYDTMLKSYIQK